MEKKKIIIILCIIIVAVIVFFIYQNTKNKKASNGYIVAEVMNSEQIKKDLKDAMKICESDYQVGLTVNPYYERGAFYNDTRLSSTYYEGKIKFINQRDIYVTEENEFLDAQGNKLTENSQLLKPAYKGEEVQISDSYELEVGKYYLVKYQKSEDDYSYCFVGKMGSNGFEDFDLYCVIEENLYEDNMNLLNSEEVELN